MKTSRAVGCFALASWFGFLTGCTTPAMRIHEKPTVFSQLPPDQQSLVQQGKVAVGFSAEAVRLALGNPDRITIRQTSAARTEVWYYMDFELGPTPGPLLYGPYGYGGFHGGYGGFYRGYGGYRGGYYPAFNYAFVGTPTYANRVYYVRYRVVLRDNRVTNVRFDDR